MTLTSKARAQAPLTLFELRSYRTKPGRRDELIAMFEEHFLDAYTEAGAHILLTSREVARPDRWTWIRAFESLEPRADSRNQPGSRFLRSRNVLSEYREPTFPHFALEARTAALARFYGSKTWKSLADACNATIADTSDARLLRPAPGALLKLSDRAPPTKSAPMPKSVIAVTIWPTKHGQAVALAGAYAERARPIANTLGAAPLAQLITDAIEGTYKRPVGQKDEVFVTLTRFETRKAYDAFDKARMANAAWTSAMYALQSMTRAPVKHLLLAPSARSVIR